MSQKENLKESRKRQILDAASNVFSKKGFHDARMDDIVKQSGLSKGTIYWYFKSKDEIITCILDDIFAIEFTHLKHLLYSDMSARERIKKFAKIALADVENYSINAPIIYEFISTASRESSVKKILKRYMRSFMEILEPIVQHGINDGEFQNIDPQEAAIAIGAVIEGIFLLWIYDSETIDLAIHMETSIDLLLNGIVRPG
ncbi:MAG: TetR/AcrR family transcriptional regulator [Anaerolineales bacterium]|jgi:AcrR family transcriptional regulator